MTANSLRRPGMGLTTPPSLRRDCAERASCVNYSDWNEGTFSRATALRVRCYNFRMLRANLFRRSTWDDGQNLHLYRSRPRRLIPRRDRRCPFPPKSGRRTLTDRRHGCHDHAIADKVRKNPQAETKMCNQVRASEREDERRALWAGADRRFRSWRWLAKSFKPRQLRIRPGAMAPFRARETPHRTRSISEVECASGSMLNMQPSSIAR